MFMTERQVKLLAAIIEQYAETATPVGSVLLAKLFDVSSATIRSEMAKLEEMGYIKQPHTSAGRIPTDKGYRIYVNSLTLEESGNRCSRVIEARVNSNIANADTAIRRAVDALVELTHNLGFSSIGGQLYLSGLANLFMQPEFVNIDNARSVARLLDNLEPWLREASPNQPLSVFIGRENPIGRNSGATLIISRFRSPFSDDSYIGVLGSTRQSYNKVMNLVGETGRMLERVLQNGE
jgi:heat-inducible transcriptional repressor